MRVYLCTCTQFTFVPVSVRFVRCGQNNGAHCPQVQGRPTPRSAICFKGNKMECLESSDENCFLSYALLTLARRLSVVGLSTGRRNFPNAEVQWANYESRRSPFLPCSSFCHFLVRAQEAAHKASTACCRPKVLLNLP